MSRFHALAISALSLALATTGCSMMTPKVSLSEYPTDTSSMMDQAAKMPTAAMLKAAQDRTKVILLRTEQSSTDGRGYQELTDALTREVEAILAANGVEIVDRTLADKLDQEIKMCEMQGNKKCGSDMQPSVARFAVKASITNASYNPVFVNAQKMAGGDGTAALLAASYPGFVERYPVDGKNDTLIVKPHFNHIAQVSTAVRVYEIPSLREVKAVVSSGSQNERTADRAPVESQLLLTALKGAVAAGDARVDLLNVFAPKGYVIGRRTNGKKTIFKISIGSSQGLLPGVPVVIASEQDSVNPITNTATTDLIDVVKGKVSDLVLPAEAWIVPDDEEKAKKVSLGDQVLVKHEMGFLDQLRKLK